MFQCGSNLVCDACSFNGVVSNLSISSRLESLSEDNQYYWQYCISDVDHDPWAYSTLDSESSAEFLFLAFHPNAWLLFFVAVRCFNLVWVDLWPHVASSLRSASCLTPRFELEEEQDKVAATSSRTSKKGKFTVRHYGTHKELRGLIVLVAWTTYLFFIFSVCSVFLVYTSNGQTEDFDDIFKLDCGDAFEGTKCIVTRCAETQADSKTKMQVHADCQAPQVFTNVRDFFSGSRWQMFFLLLALLLDLISVVVSLASNLVFPDMCGGVRKGYKLEGSHLHLQAESSRSGKPTKPHNILDLDSVKMCRVLMENEVKQLLALYMSCHAPLATLQQLFLHLARSYGDSTRWIFDIIVTLFGVLLFLFIVTRGPNKIMGLFVRFRFYGLKTFPEINWMAFAHLVTHVLLSSGFLAIVGFAIAQGLNGRMCHSDSDCSSNLQRGLVFIFFLQGLVFSLLSAMYNIVANWDLIMHTSAFSNCVLLWHSVPRDKVWRRLLFWQYSSKVVLFHPDDPAHLTNGVEAHIWKATHPHEELPKIFQRLRATETEASKQKEKEEAEERERQRVLRMPGTLHEMNKSMKPLEVLRRLKVEEELRLKRELDEKIKAKEERQAIMLQFTRWTQDHPSVNAPVPGESVAVEETAQGGQISSSLSEISSLLGGISIRLDGSEPGPAVQPPQLEDIDDETSMDDMNLDVGFNEMRVAKAPITPNSSSRMRAQGQFQFRSRDAELKKALEKSSSRFASEVSQSQGSPKSGGDEKRALERPAGILGSKVQDVKPATQSIMQEAQEPEARPQLFKQEATISEPKVESWKKKETANSAARLIPTDADLSAQLMDLKNHINEIDPSLTPPLTPRLALDQAAHTTEVGGVDNLTKTAADNEKYFPQIPRTPQTPLQSRAQGAISVQVNVAGLKHTSSSTPSKKSGFGASLSNSSSTNSFKTAPLTPMHSKSTQPKNVTTTESATSTLKKGYSKEQVKETVKKPISGRWS